MSQTSGTLGNESADALRSAQDTGMRRADIARVVDRDRRPLPREEHLPQLDARGGRAASDRNVFGKRSHQTAAGPAGRGLLSDRGHHARHRSSRQIEVRPKNTVYETYRKNL